MKWFMNWKTSTKLISAFVLIAVVVGIVGLYSIRNLGLMNNNSKQLYNNNLMSIQTLSEAQIDFLNVRVLSRDIATSSVKADKDRMAKEVEVLNKNVLDKIEAYRPLATTPEELAVLKELDSLTGPYYKLLETGMELSYRSDITEFQHFLSSTLAPAGNKIRDLMDKLMKVNMDLGDKANDTSLQTFTESRNITAALVLIALIISILLGYMISRLISNPLNRIVALVGKVSEGDLREEADIHTKDEIGQLSNSVNTMIYNLRNLIGNIAQSSQSVAAASEQISASTQEIASGSTTQAQSAQSISAMFRELTLAINSAAQSAEEAAELSDNTVQTANQGEGIVRISASGMQAVNGSMGLLEEDSRKIGAIIEVIDDIADQTNLLALNAAIEAARAGDQGRGFSVVADEVRKLAERSSEATKEITSIIKAMQDNTRQSVTAVSESVTQSEEMKEAFRNIIHTVDNSSQKVNEIAAACEEQAAQASSVMRSVESIAATSEETAAASEETAATCQSLAHLADELNVSVAKFKI
ncbi:MAG: methyl-accepting chemotaxis protein [Paenibacillaceae bacterium]|nr:methyl-accepting chemotaxis protein [Paenibacillaceae bacterium]